MNLIDFKNFTNSSQWIFAKTMPQNPHWYTLRKEHDTVLFDNAVVFIREYGHKVLFKGRPYIQYILDGFTYWTMGNPLNETILINRAKH